MLSQAVGCSGVGRAVIVEPVWWLLGQGHGALQLLPQSCLEKGRTFSVQALTFNGFLCGAGDGKDGVALTRQESASPACP